MSDGFNPKDTVVDMSKLCGNYSNGEEKVKKPDIGNVKPMTILINEGADLLKGFKSQDSEEK